MIQRSWVRFWRSILDGHDIFSHWFAVKIVMMFVWKDRKMSKKEASNECYNVLFLLVVWRNPIAHNFILSAGVDFLFWFHHFQVDLCCWSSVSLSFQLSSFRVLSWFLFSLFVSSFLFFDLVLCSIPVLLKNRTISGFCFLYFRLFNSVDSKLFFQYKFGQLLDSNRRPLGSIETDRSTNWATTTLRSLFCGNIFLVAFDSNPGNSDNSCQWSSAVVDPSALDLLRIFYLSVLYPNIFNKFLFYSSIIFYLYHVSLLMPSSGSW